MNLRGMFEEATLDFIQLQQLDFAAAFSCPHGVADLTADGLTLGFASAMPTFSSPGQRTWPRRWSPGQCSGTAAWCRRSACGSCCGSSALLAA